MTVSLANLWSEIETTVVGTVSTDVQSWLIAQYAALQAMPQTLQALARVQAALVQLPAVAGDPTLGPLVSGIGGRIQSLTTGYPVMIAPVNSAFAAVQLARSQGVNVQTGTDIAIAVAGAQQFTQGVTSVQTDLISVINQALASGAITPAQASSLASSVNAPTGSGWAKYLLYGVLAYVAYRLVKKVL